jgi:hypothetical protein
MPSKTTLFNFIIWLFRTLTRPFQVTKTIELLYALDWAWLTIMSFLPEGTTSNTNIDRLKSSTNPFMVSGILLVIALLSAYSLVANIVMLRKVLLLLNLALILFLSANSLFKIPISTNVGYLLILAILTILAYWRIDVT